MTQQRRTNDPARNSVPRLRADASGMAQRPVPSTEIRPGVESHRAGNLRRGVAWLASMLVAASLSVVEVSAADRASQDRTDGHRLVAGADAVLRDAVSSGSTAGTCVTFDAIPVASNRPNACQIISGEGTNTVTLAGNDCEIEVEVFISNWACTGENLSEWSAKLGGDNGGGLDSALPTGISRPAGIPCSEASEVGDAECVAAGYQPTFRSKGCGARLVPQLSSAATRHTTTAARSTSSWRSLLAIN